MTTSPQGRHAKRSAPRRERSREAYGRSPIVLVCAAAIILATALLAGFSMLTARDQVADSRAAARSAGLAALYGDARPSFVSESFSRSTTASTPRPRPSPAARAGKLRADSRVAVADTSPATRMTLGALALADRRYTKVSDEPSAPSGEATAPWQIDSTAGTSIRTGRSIG